MVVLPAPIGPIRKMRDATAMPAQPACRHLMRVGMTNFTPPKKSGSLSSRFVS
jgi:hypothetical protein